MAMQKETEGFDWAGEKGEEMDGNSSGGGMDFTQWSALVRALVNPPSAEFNSLFVTSILNQPEEREYALGCLELGRKSLVAASHNRIGELKELADSIGMLKDVLESGEMPDLESQPAGWEFTENYSLLESMFVQYLDFDSNLPVVEPPPTEASRPKGRPPARAKHKRVAEPDQVQGSELLAQAIGSEIVRRQEKIKSIRLGMEIDKREGRFVDYTQVRNEIASLSPGDSISESQFERLPFYINKVMDFLKSSQHSTHRPMAVAMVNRYGEPPQMRDEGAQTEHTGQGGRGRRYRPQNERGG